MKRLLLLVLFWTTAAFSQVVGPGFVDYVTSAPSGACSQGAHQQNVLGNGQIWTCQSGTWGQVGGGGGGTGTVTSVGLTVNGGSSSGALAVTGSPITTSGTFNLAFTGTNGDVMTFGASNAPTDSGTLLSSLAPLASPALTGVPTAPTAAPATNTTQLATTAFVIANPGTPAWNTITNPAGNLALSMGTNTSIFSGTAATNQFFAWKNTTAAVVGTSQGSPALGLCGRAFHGSADVEDCLTLKELPGNGNDAAITFTLGHTGTSTGAITTNFPGPISANGSTSGAAVITPPVTGGTSTSPWSFANVIQVPNGANGTPGISMPCSATACGMWASGQDVVIESADRVYFGSGTLYWYFNTASTGELTPNLNLTYDIGDTTHSVRNLFSGTYNTGANCSNAASPAVCGAAASGVVAVPTGNNPTLQINTTAVTANSRIFLEIDESATIAATTCNTTLSTLIQPVVTARTAGTSFTIQIGAVLAANPACVSYFIVN